MNKKKQLTAAKPSNIVTLEAGQQISPIQAAMQSGASPAELLQFMELQERYDANEARKAYVKAMAEFKANPPEIRKTKHVKYQNKDGTYTEYWHAKIGEMASLISEAMAPHGLSFTWDTEQLDKGMIRVTCVITHDLGHSERTPLQSGADQSGGKNNIQAIGSTLKYLQRYTLEAATGVSSDDMDDDGASSEVEMVPRITDDQVLTIHAAITENEIDMDTVLAWMKTALKVETLEEININGYPIVMNKINATIKNKAKNNAED